MRFFRIIKKFIKSPKWFVIDALENRRKFVVSDFYRSNNFFVVFNMHLWKRDYIQKWFPNKKFIFVPMKITQKRLINQYLPLIRLPNVEVLSWGMNLPSIVKENTNRIVFVEDGFIRSVGLGANHALPLSLCFDTETLYFDSTKASNLENLLNTYDFESNRELIERAIALRDYLTLQGISKYNHNKRVGLNDIYGETEKKRILVIGQVEDDASIIYGCNRPLNNLDLLKIAIEENPEAQIIYKPHPDIMNNKRSAISDISKLKDLCLILNDDISISSCLESVNHVYTITSLVGFEALLRNITVTTLGSPFYSGWGLTDDRQKNFRRKRNLSIEELLAGTYILYPRYFDAIGDKGEIEVEDAIAILSKNILYN